MIKPVIISTLFLTIASVPLAYASSYTGDQPSSASISNNAAPASKVATNTCYGKSSGTDCEYTNSDSTVIVGTCQKQENGQMACSRQAPKDTSASPE
jgi:hypothetical protein